MVVVSGVLKVEFTSFQLGLMPVKAVRDEYDGVIRISVEVFNRLSPQAGERREEGGKTLVITPSHLRKGFQL